MGKMVLTNSREIIRRLEADGCPCGVRTINTGMRKLAGSSSCHIRAGISL